jgi:uncharacterized membrane protein
MRRLFGIVTIAFASVLVVGGCTRKEEASLPDTTSSTSDAPAATTAVAEPETSSETSAAESSLSVKRGVVMLAQDRATFRPCDEKAELWIVDQTDGLLKEQFGAKGGGEPAMIYVEVYGERAPVTDDMPAPARAYAGTLVLEDVLYAGVAAEVRGCAAPAPSYVVSARGNEPSWSVEVTDTQVTWRQATAPKEITLKAPQTEDAEGAVRYRASGEGHELELLIGQQHCKDSMSGEFFAYAAKATFDGRELAGCAHVTE